MLKWTWKFADWGMFFFGFVVVVAVLLLPSNERDIKELERVAQERRAEWARYEAALQKQIDDHREMSARQAEELGIVYLPVPSTPPDEAAPAAPNR